MRILLLLLLLFPVTIHAQSRPTAGRIMGGSGVPGDLNGSGAGDCNSTTTLTDIYIRSGVPAASSIYLCNTSAWVLFAGGGVTNSAGNNIITKSDGTNLVASTITDTGSLVAFGGVTSSFPALKRSTTTLQHRLADDSADGPMSASTGTFSAAVTATAFNTSATAAGTIGLCEPTGTGSDCVTLAAPASVTTAFTMKMPAAPSAGVLRFDGTDALTFVAPMEKVWLPAAGCNNATAASFWDLPTSTPAVAACVTGSNTQKGVLDFADTSGGFSAQNGLLLPSDFTGTLDANIIWTTTATTGNAKWSLSTICTAINATETDDPAFNTASTVTVAAPGTANRVQTSPITTVTITGCAASELLHVRIFRDGNDGSDTVAATVRLIGVELSYRRNVQ